jgi:hypothetical protein
MDKRDRTSLAGPACSGARSLNRAASGRSFVLVASAAWWRSWAAGPPAPLTTGGAANVGR